MDAPREELVRAIFTDGLELRVDDDGGMPTLFGHFLRFNEWTEIHSWWEGDFLERIAPGACKKTFSENRESIRCLFQHGYDPQVGDKPLGPIAELREDGTVGAYYEVPLLDAAYTRDLIPGLEAGLYGASFRFAVVKEEWNDDPGTSPHNPKGLPERTLKEIRIREFGPVTFPAYPGATAGVRSLTDDFLDRLLADPRVAERLTTTKTLRTRSGPEAAPGTPAEESTSDRDGAASPADEPPAGHSAVPFTHRRARLRRAQPWRQKESTS